MRRLQFWMGVLLISIAALFTLTVIPLIAGIMLLLDGLGLFAKKQSPAEVQSKLDLTILEMVSQGKKTAEIAASTGVASQIVERKTGELVTRGLITPEGFLSEKGYEVLKQK